MNATILKITEKIDSKHPEYGKFYYIFFKGEDGKSYRTCTGPKYRNFELWRPLCENPDIVNGTLCEGLVVRAGGLIDADYLTKTRLKKETPTESAPESAKQAKVVPLNCGICKKSLQAGNVIELTVNVGPGDSEKNYKKILLHQECRDKIFDDYAKANEIGQGHINQRLVDYANGIM